MTGAEHAGNAAAGDPVAEVPLHADLSARVTALETAQEASSQGRGPWYRQASVLLSVLALVFSMTATWFGEQRAGERDEVAARAELSQLIQRLVSLPRENAELQKLYAGDASMLNELGALVATENDVLARQASDIIGRIPDRVSGSEYMAVAQALLQTGNYGLAEPLLDAGIARSRDATSRAGLWRVKGSLLFATGDVDGGRAAMSNALGAYAAELPSVATAADAYTELAWSSAEKLAGECDDAEEHLDRARAHLDSLQLTPYRVQMLALLSGVATTATAACPGS